MTCRLRMLRAEFHFFGMSFYRRRLPHWQPEGVPIFLTWRLYGSLPRSLWEGRSQTCPTWLTEGRRFLLMDRELDSARGGFMFLKHPLVAASVADTLLMVCREWGFYDLFAWVIMSNHVHVLLQPHKPLRRITHVVKSTSARRANVILGRSGLRFWQDESFDHWARDGKELERIVQYIEWNPVRAGLVERVELWPWSSAAKAWQVTDLPHKASNVHEFPLSYGTLPLPPNSR
jgi:REP element-mobilizing transposase RayT